MISTPTSVDLQPIFARHETFHPRIGWLTKAVEATSRDPYVFSAPDAPVVLGVGKNMVRAIRYWGIATKVVAEAASVDGSRIAPVRPTRLGMLLLGPNGWDRYLEDPHSLWLLHWHLLATPVYAPVWWWTFHTFDRQEFSSDELVRFSAARAATLTTTEPAASSIAKDVDCLLRMYAKRPTSTPWLDSPFTALGLLEASSGDVRRWRFGRDTTDPIDGRVVGLASLDALRHQSPSARTIRVARLAIAPGGPGRAFRMTEEELASSLASLHSRNPDVAVRAVAGIAQLVIDDDPAVIAVRLLTQLYAAPAPDLTRLESLYEVADAA